MLAAERLTKRFGEVLANDAVSFDVAAGEIHALLGENGAGKSTLVKMLYGALRPDAGRILWRGAPAALASPNAARALGVGMVFQHFSLFDALSVAENVALALPERPAPQAVRGRIAEVAAAYGLSLAPDALIADLSVGQRQRVEIVRVLMQDPQLIILDEPTSVLTPQEAEQLFAVLERLRGEGRAVLYISHKLDEVRRLCDRATVLRRGRVVGACDPRAETAASLARMMVGEDVRPARAAEAEAAEAAAGAAAAPALEVAGLSLAPDRPFGVALREVSFTLRPGELKAVAGVAGNGQSELFDALSGERSAPRAAAVRMMGVDVGRLGVTARRRLGAAFVSEERLGHGAAPDESLSANIALTRARTDPELAPRGLLDRAAARRVVARVAAAFDVRRAPGDPPARSLSGGNLQKFVVGREVDRDPALLIIDQPTWGVDAAAAARIRQTLIDRARAGAAILVISQDLDEIFEIAGAVAALNGGRLSPFAPTAETSREAVGLMLTGASGAGAPAPAPAEIPAREGADAA